MENSIKNIVEESSLRPPVKEIVINGRRKIAVNGVVNLNIPKGAEKTNVVPEVDDNCLVIDVCRRLDVSVEGNEVCVQIPEGYIGDARSYGANNASIYWLTYGSDPNSWSTAAEVDIVTVRADTSQVVTTTATIGNYSSGTASVATPFITSYLKIKVTTPCTGATKPYVMFTFRIFCHKE